MAHSLSAKKRVRQNATHQSLNRRRIRSVKLAIKKFLGLIQQGSVEEAQKQLVQVSKVVDKIAATGTLHRNAAARYKSRLTIRLNNLKKSKAKAA